MKKIIVVLMVLFISQQLFALDNWIDVSNPDVSVSLIKLQVFDNNLYFIKTSGNYYLLSSNQGASWNKLTLNFTPSANQKYEFASENNIYWLIQTGNNYYQKLLKSTNTGVSFDTIRKTVNFGAPYPYGFDDVLFINSQFGFLKENVFPTSGGFNATEYLFKTTNGGITWDTSAKFPYFSSTIGGGGGWHAYFNSYKFSKDNTTGFAAYIYHTFAGGGPGSTNYSRLMKTLNGGANWIDVSPLIISTTYNDIVYCDSTWAYFTSSNASGTKLMRFRDTSIAIDTICQLSGKYNFKDRKEGFCYTGSTLSYSNDSGRTWVGGTLGHGITNVTFINNNLGFALTDDGKIFRTTNGGLISSIMQSSSEVPDKYSLFQNYPNPFNPSTKINYEIKSSGFVSLKVFDLLGKEVATLVNENQTAGSYAVDFKSSEFNLPSGIYFYTLNAGEFKETKKMVLVK